MSHESLDVRKFSCFPLIENACTFVLEFFFDMLLCHGENIARFYSQHSTHYKLPKYSVGEADPCTCYSIAQISQA
jgi:hypothetical protein